MEHHWKVKRCRPLTRLTHLRVAEWAPSSDWASSEQSAADADTGDTLPGREEAVLLGSCTTAPDGLMGVALEMFWQLV